jgi:hypothetical protein
MDLLTIVCCTPDKPERKEHMRALCLRERLEPHFTTDLGLFVHKESCHALTGAFPDNPAYKAHYLTYIRALRYFVSTGRPYLLLFEDDLVRTDGGAVSVTRIIADAPPFDLLFLEYCYANCPSPGPSGPRYATGLRAACTGACVFSRPGARAFLAFAASNHMVIDWLTPLYAATMRGNHRTLYLSPPAFQQDRSLFADGVTGAGEHGFPPVCASRGAPRVGVESLAPLVVLAALALALAALHTLAST